MNSRHKNNINQKNLIPKLKISLGPGSYEVQSNRPVSASKVTQFGNAPRLTDLNSKREEDPGPAHYDLNFNKIQKNN